MCMAPSVSYIRGAIPTIASLGAIDAGTLAAVAGGGLACSLGYETESAFAARAEPARGAAGLRTACGGPREYGP
jgi:hypothetical protein